MPRELQLIVLLGGPGLVVGLILGALLPKWKVVIALIAVGGIALLFGFNHFPEGAADDDDDPIVLLALAMATNFGGWVVGLSAGAATARVLSRDKA